ncbi:MAG: diacylglycerol kinase family protein [Gemmatimonadota bacterium]
MDAIVLLNAGAGSVDETRTESESTRVKAAFEDAGVRARVEAVAAERIMDAARAAAADADVVVVGGGDGTLSAAACALVGGETPLAVLPLGTLNHFAKDLGMPTDLEEAVTAIVGGHVRSVDVGELNGRPFLNNSSIGLYPRAVEEREAKRERSGWAKWPAMLHGALVVVRRFRLLRVRLRTEDRALLLRTPFVFVGNNRYEMSLFSPGKRSRLDGGELSLYVARVHGPLGLLPIVGHAITGTLDQARDFESLWPREVEIHAGRRALRVALDGEVLRMRAPLRYRIRPAALRVVAPAAP